MDYLWILILKWFFIPLTHGINNFSDRFCITYSIIPYYLILKIPKEGQSLKSVKSVWQKTTEYEYYGFQKLSIVDSHDNCIYFIGLLISVGLVLD